MNIYLHVEISARELDSKILLACLAAERGHNVMISELNIFKKALKNKLIPPGIFHAKSLSPNNDLISRHQEMIENRLFITSIDEEGGLLDHEYDEFAKNRYSSKTIEQSSAIFCWGEDDFQTLKKIYPKFSSKIHKTGSPRADTWREQFSKSYALPPTAPSKPFILISSNLHTVNNIKPFHEWGGFKSHKTLNNDNYFKSDPDNFKKQFNKVSEDNLKFAAFVEAVHFLSSKSLDFDIIFRPHPLENIDPWKVYLRGLPNVYVNRDGPIGPWLNNAFGIIHNSCTTAIEATISGKEVITYIPFEQNNSWGELANSLGHCVKTLDDLSNKVHSLFKKSQNNEQSENIKPFPEILLNKIHLDKGELAAKKIIKIWEEIANQNELKNSDLAKFKLFLRSFKIKKILQDLFEKLVKIKRKSQNEDKKFPPIDLKEVRKKVDKMSTILKLENKIECELLHNKTILIKKT